MAVMLFEWAFTATFLIIVMLILRAALGGRVSAGLRYALWAVVLVRLLVPVQLFTSPVAGTWVMTEKRTEKIVYAPAGPSLTEGERDGVLSLGGQDGPSVTLTTFPGAPNPPALPDAPEPPQPPDLTRAPAWLGWTWLAGSAAVAFVLLASNLRFFWKLRRERILLDGGDLPLRVYVAAGLPSPCLFGLIRPAIYVTPEAAADPAMLRHVLAHEYTHYRHGDHIWSLLRCAALAAHWWNPLVWLAVRLSQRDGELACDEGAIKRLGDGERAAYGNTLLVLVTAKPAPGDLFRCATTMAGDKKSLKERVSRIAQAPRRVLWAVIVAVTVTALACLCAFGQRLPEDDPVPSADPTASAEPLPTEEQHEPKDWDDLSARFAVDVEGVPEDVMKAAVGKAQAAYDGWRGDTSLKGTPQFDDWRIYDLAGPWEETTESARFEIWRLGYEIHTTTPERVKVTSGGALDGEGWFRPHQPDSVYLLFTLENGVRTYRTDFFSTDCGPGDPEFQEILKSLGRRLADPEACPEADLNRNGVPEELRVVSIDGDTGRRLEVWENSKLLYEEEGYYAHVGYNSLFLCTLDGEDYLLRYHPTMYQGYCTYNYQLFTLENGGETVVKEGEVEFDDNFAPMMHQSFDPEAINAFMEEVNGLLAHSVQLLNTDDYLADTFEKEGRLYDSLWWLDTWEPTFVRDENASLEENLRDYQAAMEAQWYAETPRVFPVDELGTDIQLSYQDKTARFESPGWDYNFQPAEYVEPPVVDLDGDGREEIVVILVGGHGTGAMENYLYLFDADTLEQYDTAGLNQRILGQIESAGDGDGYSLSAPWMGRISVPREAAGEYNEYAPAADALALGDVIEYSLEEDGLHCRLGCDASGMAINYIGYLDIALGFAPQEGVRCVSAQYMPYE